MEHTAPEPMAEVRVFGTPRGTRDFSAAPGRFRVGRVRFGGWQIHPVPTRAFAEDAYLVRATFDLVVEPQVSGPLWAEAGFAFAHGVTVLDAVPQTVREAQPAGLYTLTPMLNFAPADTVPEDGRPVPLGALSPAIDAFGVGDSTFRWRWTAADRRGVHPGSRSGWFVLLVPPGTRELRVRPLAGYAVPDADELGLDIGQEPADCTVALPVPEPAPERAAVREAAADVVVLTALREEADAVIAAVGDCTERRGPDVVLHEGSVAGRRVLIVPMSSMGNASAAQAAQQAIDVWRPARLLLVGIAGGIPAGADDLRLGDVLVPDQIVGYELGKLTAAGDRRRYDVYRPDPALLADACAMPPKEWVHTIGTPRPDGTDGRELPRVHVGPVLSGEKVIADAGALPGVAEAWPKAVGVEMESYGVALAAHRGGAAFLMVKAVSDLRDAAKDDRWRRYAADVAARFVVALLRRGAHPSDPR